MFTEDQGTGLIRSLKSLFAAEKKAENEKPIDEFIEEYIRPSLVGSDVPTNAPMSTRTVVFEAKEVKLFSEEDKDYPTENLDITFAENLIQHGGKFMFCETMADAVKLVRELSETNQWAHVYYWENEIKDMFHNNDFQRGMVGYTMEKSYAVCNLCETMIAENGTILLNSKQASMRRLPVFPKTQIIFANADQVCYSLAQAMRAYKKKHGSELPSLLNLADNKAGNFYHEGQLVMKADGTEDVYLILIDEKIPVSNRV